MPRLFPSLAALAAAVTMGSAECALAQTAAEASPVSGACSHRALATALQTYSTDPADHARAYAELFIAVDGGCVAAGPALERLKEDSPAVRREAAIDILAAMIADGRFVPSSQLAEALALPAPRRPRPVPARIMPPSAHLVPHAPHRAPAPAPRPIAFMPRGQGWSIQLGAFAVAGKARRHWAALAASRSALQGHAPLFARYGMVWRVRVAGLATRSAADALCGEARATGSACYVVRPAAAPVRLAARAGRDERA